MTPDWISLFALVLIIFISRWERVDIGVLAMAMAWGIGFYLGRMELAEIFDAFPLSLFMILFGVTFFFALAGANGTLNHITDFLIRCARGRTRSLPVLFFFLSLGLAAIGPGNIGAVALLAPLAMAIAAKTGIGAFFMTMMLINGANAGTFSPFSPTGIIANGLIARLGLAMDPWMQVFLPSLLAQSALALGWYAVWVMRMRRQKAVLQFHIEDVVKSQGPFHRHHLATIVFIVLFILGVIVLKADVGFWAIGLAALVMILGVSDGKTAVAQVPWNIIIMVCGVSMLVNVMGETGGLDLFTSLLAKISNPANVTAMLALTTGIISSYSSSSGVVIPAFIPIVPGLIEKIGGGDPVALVASINVGSHVVDVSPLSTLGALCVAGAAKEENKNQLFRRLLFLGLSMSLVGATICYVFFGWLGR